MLSVASARRIENREDLQGKGTTIARVNVMMNQAATRFKTVAAGSMRLQVGFQGGVEPFTEKFKRDGIRILAAARRLGTPNPLETQGMRQCTRKAHKRVEPRVHNTQVTIHKNIQVSSDTMLDAMLAQRLDFKM